MNNNFIVEREIKAFEEGGYKCNVDTYFMPIGYGLGQMFINGQTLILEKILVKDFEALKASAGTDPGATYELYLLSKGTSVKYSILHRPDLLGFVIKDYGEYILYNKEGLMMLKNNLTYNNNEILLQFTRLTRAGKRVTK